jgi:hypothetical protein
VERPAARRVLLALLLSLGFALRAALALSGGQRYFPDENRYLRCFIVLRQIERAEWRAALDQVLDSPDHTGFLAVGLVPAALQRAYLRATGLAETRPSVDATAWLPALLLGMGSLACIGLVGALARRAGAAEDEGLLAAFLMLCSTSMLGPSRHLLPYDSALALALAALWLGMAGRQSLPRSLAVGLVAGCAFLTYNGYWLVALTAIGLHTLHRSSTWPDRARRAVVAGLGFALVPGLLTALSVARGREPYVLRLLRFSREAATQTDFSEGWSLPWAYLWHSEHGVLLALLAGALATLRFRDRGRLWLGAAASMYATMVVLSNGFERIGTFGRISRSLVPFLCLAAALTGARLLAKARGATLALCLALAVQASYNFAAPYRLRFPRDVLRELEQRYGELGRDTTVVVDPSPEERPLPNARYVLLNARYLYPVSGAKAAPPGRELFRTAHPLEYLPYQYEGYVPRERALLRSNDVSIRLLDTRPD